MIGAIGIDGIRGSMTVHGTIDGEVVRTFFEKILAANMNENDILILDNLSVHKVASVRDFVSHSKFKMMFLPPYSPDFNPIEMLWSKVKGALRGFEARTYRTLDKAMTLALRGVTSSDARGWFNHCGFSYQPD
jgi:transposase